MRRRLVISTIAIVLVVLGALALPVGLIVQDATQKQVRAQLESRAMAIKTTIDADLAAGRDTDDEVLRRLIQRGDGLTIVRIDDAGEQQTHVVQPAVRSTNVTERTASDGSTSIMMSTDAGALNADVRGQIQILLMLTLGGIAAAAGLAAVQAHQLARPLERLATRAARIGDGDFSRRPFTRTQIPEIDHIGTALDTSSMRVESMLANERHFTADATHQLRTGIAGIAMRLELLSLHDDATVASDAAEGLRQTDQLNATIDDLLAAARNRTINERETYDLAALVHDHANEWRPRFHAERRHLSVITSNPAAPVFGTKGLAGQVIDILIDNALKHGGGAATLMIDEASVTVTDQGPGMTQARLAQVFDGPVDPSAKHGRGLALARRLAQVDGATLDVVGNRPMRLRFNLVRGELAPSGELTTNGDRHQGARQRQAEPPADGQLG